jgi:hypothetical protein
LANQTERRRDVACTAEARRVVIAFQNGPEPLSHDVLSETTAWKLTAPKTFYTSIQFLLGRSLHAQCKTLVSDLKQKWNVSTNGGKFPNIKFHYKSTVFVLSHGHSHRPCTAKSCSFAIPFTYMPKTSLGNKKKLMKEL